MDFVPITIEAFIKRHLKDNPDTDVPALKQQLQHALDRFRAGEKCACGEDIWVIGSAFMGKACFRCITGESPQGEDYEIDEALPKFPSVPGRRHIDDMDPTQIAGFFTDDGYEVNPELIKKPGLCLRSGHVDGSR